MLWPEGPLAKTRGMQLRFVVRPSAAFPMTHDVPRNLLVVHGALGSSSVMAPITDALRELGDVHAIEFPGHGSTMLPDAGAFSIHAFAQALRDDVRRISGAPPIVFGYSMGGYVALTLEAQHPGTLAGIVTLGTKFEWTPDHAARESARLDPVVIAEKVPRFAAALEARHARAGGWHALMSRTAALLHDIAASPSLTPERLAAITIPVRIAVGTRDDTVSIEEAARVASMMPNASSIPLEDVAHPIERVPAGAIVELVRDLLA